jgi:hypothetical protein
VLANALFYVALIAMAASTLLSAGAAMTRVTILRLSQSALNSGYQRAAAALQQRLATEIAARGFPSPLPSFTPLPQACAGGSAACTYKTGATIALTQPAPETFAAACNPSSSNCATNEEANVYVDEHRLSARITVSVSGPDGTVLVARSADVVLRTFSIPPYVAIAGSRDGSFDSFATDRAPGDDSGALPATPDPCASAAPASDTVVRVAYRNAVTNACIDGSAWRDGSYSVDGSAAGWSP